MRWIPRSSARPAFGIALLATLAMVVPASSAATFPLRQPQVVFQSASLQGLLDGQGAGVDVTTAQLDAQDFGNLPHGLTDFVFVMKLASSTGLHTVGVYNTGVATPARFRLFPDTATADYTVACRFVSLGPDAGKLKVFLFDAVLNLVDTTTYTGVVREAFGFYVQGAGGTVYSQDSLNGGLPQLLTYTDAGISPGSLWLCFDDMPYAASASTFDDVLLAYQEIVPDPCRGASSRIAGLLGIGCVPTVTSTWGQLKSIYR